MLSHHQFRTRASQFKVIIFSYYIFHFILPIIIILQAAAVESVLRSNNSMASMAVDAMLREIRESKQMREVFCVHKAANMLFQSMKACYFRVICVSDVISMFNRHTWNRVRAFIDCVGPHKCRAIIFLSLLLFPISMPLHAFIYIYIRPSSVAVMIKHVMTITSSTKHA